MARRSYYPKEDGIKGDLQAFAGTAWIFKQGCLRMPCLTDLRRNVVVLALAVFSVVPAIAQTQAINGSIRGRVTDQADAPVADAKITVTNTQTDFARSDQSNEDGYYVFPNLPLGSYTVTVEKSGFNTEAHPGVVLDAGVQATIDAQLKVGNTQTRIEVTGGAPVVDPSRVNISVIISHQETENLPLTSRNPYNFVLLQPGVSGHPNAELGIPRLLNTNGLVDHVNYQLDGTVDTESDRYGLRLFAIADSYVNEVQAVPGVFAPEFGRIAGDVYNVITPSGSNDFHGEVQFVGRPLDLVARPILATRTTPIPAANDFSANSGGKIIKDKLFFFASYEHIKRATPTPVTITATNAAAIGIPSNLLATATTVQHAQWVDARLDWLITQKHQFFVRYNYFRNQYPFNTNNGGLYALSSASDFRDRAHVAGAQLLSTFSPNVLNELRFGWPYRNEAHIANALTGTGPEITISGIANFGGSTAVGDRFQEKIPNLNDNFTVVKGAHTLKAGFGFQQNLDTQVNDIYTQYVFANIPAYLAAASGANPYAYNTFNASVGQPGAWYHSFFYDLFAQDSWQVRPNLLAVFGVRYDQFRGPQSDPNAQFAYSQHFRIPEGDFAPRLGFAWSVTPKTVVRFSSGIFYEAPPTNLWYNALYNDGGSSSYVAAIAASAAGAPPFPSMVANGTLPRSSQNITAITPQFKNGYAINSSIQLTRQLFKNDSISVTYANTGGRNLEYLRNINLINPIAYLGDGRPVYSTTRSVATRLYPAFNNITLEDIGANSSYNAATVSYQRRFAEGLELTAFYTWSHSIDDAPEANAYDQGSLVIEDPTNRNRDRGNSSINRPDAFSLSTVWSPTANNIGNRILRYLANNNQLTLFFVAQSGDEQNLTANQLLNGDALAGSGAASSTRPLFIGRDTVRTPNVYQLDARYTRTFFKIWERFQPRFFAEANNVLNHPNITTINTTAVVNTAGTILTQPTYAPVSTLLEGRILQLGVRADW